jgi:TRAP transporter TAXI family solute receptor
MKKFLALLLIVSMVGFTLAGCAKEAPAEEEAPAVAEEATAAETTPEDQFVTILTGGSSGPYFALGGAVSNLLNEKLSYVNASVESTGASAVNSTKIGMGEAEIAFAMNNVVSFAYNGAESTRKMKSSIGRAKWFVNRSIGVLDPGALSGYLIIKTFAEYIVENLYK